MYYYVPAWYSNSKRWGDNNKAWYNRVVDIDFDDTINHVRMFQESQEMVSLVILNYMPSLRTYTHRFDLLEVSQWSLFDQLQGIHTPFTQQLDFTDLSWPEGVEFVYTPFLVIAQYKGDLLAHIHFGDSGQLIWVDYYANTTMTKRYIFDDRGFLSSIMHFTATGQEWYQTYFNHLGEWRFKEYLLAEDCHVEINPNISEMFSKTTYPSMTALIQESLGNYLKEVMDKEDTLFISSEDRHNQLVLNAQSVGKTVLSYFEHRNTIDNLSSVADDCGHVDLVLVDSRALYRQIEPMISQKVLHIPLFDTRLQLGKSQRHKEEYLYFLIDGLSEEDIKEASERFFAKMEQDDRVMLSYISYERNENQQQDIERLVKAVLAQSNFSLKDDDDVRMFEVGDDEEDEDEVIRVTLDFLPAELDIMTQMSAMRLVIDLSQDPHLYTQIASISSGIPQINRVETEFMEHQKTGYLLENLSDLSKALDYYLNGFTNWNATLVNIVQKIGDYTGGQLIARIKREL